MCVKIATMINERWEIMMLTLSSHYTSIWIDLMLNYEYIWCCLSPLFHVSVSGSERYQYPNPEDFNADTLFHVSVSFC